MGQVPDKSIESSAGKTGKTVKKTAKSPGRKKTPNATKARNRSVDNGTSADEMQKKGNENGVLCFRDNAAERINVEEGEMQILPIARLCIQDPDLRLGRIDLLEHVPMLSVVMPNIEDIFTISKERRLHMHYLGKNHTIDEYFAALDLDSQTKGKII